MSLVGAFALLTACAGPERVVEQAIDAARAGDRAAYAQCFTARSRAILQTFWVAADAERPALGALGAGDVKILGIREMHERGFGPERAVVTLEEGGERFRLVLHEQAGTWRIDLLDTERALIGLSSF